MLKGTVTLNNTRITGNTAGRDGGGIFNRGTVALNDLATVSLNTAEGGAGSGGGILNAGTVTGHTGDVFGSKPDNIASA